MRDFRQLGIKPPKSRPEIDRRTPFGGYTRPQLAAIEAAKAELARRNVAVIAIPQEAQMVRASRDFPNARAQIQRPPIPSHMPRTGLSWREQPFCYWCGQEMDADPFSPRFRTREHLVPRSKGGDSSLANLVAACITCNNRRGTSMTWRSWSTKEMPAAYHRRADRRMPRGQRERRGNAFINLGERSIS